MIAAIMQPYFFPYIGYFQLMNVVDTFVIFDDVQYIDRGWVNRNRILVSGKPTWLTMPTKKESRILPINRRQYALDKGCISTKLRIQSTYVRYPAFEEIFPIVSDILDFRDGNIAKFNANLLVRISELLGIRPKFIMSSDIMHDGNKKGEAKIIDICKIIGATSYINPIGGISLYDPNHFISANITLSFLQTTVAPTAIGSEPHHLSIIHELMLHGTKGTANRLGSYEILHE